MSWKTPSNGENQNNPREKLEEDRIGDLIKNLETVIAFLEKEKTRYESDLVRVSVESQKIIEQRKGRVNGDIQ